MQILAAILAAMTMAFPREGARMPAITNCYVIGAVGESMAAAEASAGISAPLLTVNGATTDVWRTGAFLAMVPVQAGTNTITACWGTNTLVRRFTVEAPRPPSATPPSKPHDPYADLGIPAGRTAKPPPRERKPNEVYVLVDPGHGGQDTGAVSPHGRFEKDANLMQAIAIRDALAGAGFRVAMTREDDSFPPLYERPRRAFREDADIFISVHHNATAANSNPRVARHSATYASNDAGMALAAAIQRHVAAAVAPVPDRGALGKSLAVCRNPVVPSCLLEVDFINLPEGEEAVWEDAARRDRVARAVVMGVLDWMYSSASPAR